MGRWSFSLLLLLVAPPALRAQDGSPRLGLTLPGNVRAASDAPTVSLADVLSEGHRRELLNSGWPAALHCKVELWKKGWLLRFDREGVVEWDMIVEYAPATHMYHVRRAQDGRDEDLGEVASIEAAEQLVDRSYRVPLSPASSGGRYYYNFTVVVSTLSQRDLDAWQKWVRGDATPAVRGTGNVLTAIKNGFGTMLSRMLGGETQTYEAHSLTFTAG